MLYDNGKVELKKLIETDAIALSQLCNNKKIWDNLRDYIPFPYTTKEAADFISFCQNEDPQTTFAIYYQNSFVGVIGLVLQHDIYRLSAEVGYWIGEPYWKRGIATEALNLICTYAFENLNMLRIYSGVFDSNKASQRVLEKCGFKLEAVLEKSLIKNGVVRDEYRYSKINQNFIQK